MHDDLLPALPAGFVTNLISPQASTLYKVQSTEVAIFILGVSFYMFCSVRLCFSKTVSEPKVDAGQCCFDRRPKDLRCTLVLFSVAKIVLLSKTCSNSCVAGMS